MTDFSFNRIRATRWPALLLGASIVLALVILGVWSDHRSDEPVRLGILHAVSGPASPVEKPTIDAELLAIEELNAAGGINGQQIEPVILDSGSNEKTTARTVEEFLSRETSAVIIGCHTSDCRKAVKPLVEAHRGLLLYPMSYEGLELSRNIIYTGPTPNQQILPAVNWSFDNLGKRFYLIGSDYIWPHCINAIIRDHLTALGGEVVGEDYIAMGESNVAESVEKIRRAAPDVILSSVLGSSMVPFFETLKKTATQHDPHIVAFPVTEVELSSLPAGLLTGQYTAWSYFQNIERPENKSFVARFKARYGADRAINDVMQTAYTTVYLWAQGLEAADSPDAEEVGLAISGLSHNAPEGIISVDPSTRHAWRSFNMGQIDETGQIRIVWSAGQPIRPAPFPMSRTRQNWQTFVENLYRSWNNHWVNDPANLTGQDNHANR